MTREQQVEICAGCKNRKFDLNKGIICGKTGESGVFEQECPEYEADEKKAVITEYDTKDPELMAGFLKFYVYWLLPVGGILTLVLAYILFDPSLWKVSLFLPLYDICFSVIYCLLCIYVMLAFINCKTDAVFMAKFQLALLGLSHLPILLFTNAPIYSYSAIAWSIIIFTYLSFSKSVKERIPKETRKLTKFSKIFLPIAICIPIICMALGLTESITGKRFFASAKDQIELYCDALQKELPDDEWHSVFVDGNAVVYGYNTTLGEMTDNEEERYVILNRECILMSLKYEEYTDQFLKLCLEAEYDLEYRYIDDIYGTSTSVVVTSEMVDNLVKSGYNHVISNVTWEKFTDLYNVDLPRLYFDDCTLQSMSVYPEKKTIYYELELTNTPIATLANITSDVLKEHILSNFNELYDDSITLALISNFDIEYHFTTDSVDWWQTTVRLNLDEVSKYYSFE